MPNELRGAVLAKFPTIAAFAKAMKWDRKKASRIVNHIQEPSVNDLYKMVEVLDIRGAEAVTRIFLPKLTTK
jgi:hypothetical protein